MSGRVLVVDDVAANRRLFEALLARDYLEVTMAASAEEALEAARRDPPDLVLLDVRLPGQDGFTVCKALKSDPQTRHIPVVLVTALGDRESRLKGFTCGADDFITKPVDGLQLAARARSLVRLKRAMDELRRREADGRRIGLFDTGQVMEEGPARVLVLNDPPGPAARLADALAAAHHVRLGDLEALGRETSASLDLCVAPLAAKAHDPLWAVARLQAREDSRDIQVLAYAECDQGELAVRALDLGAHDILPAPLDPEELLARTRVLVRRKRMMEAWRAALEEGLELAVTDPLTGLHNRRYLLAHLKPLVKRAELGGGPVALLLFDLDHFKRINDQYGHDAGDDVLREFSARIAAHIRPTDIACRLGGEEFVVVMPGARGDYARLAADRLRLIISAEPFKVRALQSPLRVTVSIGVASTDGDCFDADVLLKRADEGLYKAKAQGRDRVAEAA